MKGIHETKIQTFENNATFFKNGSTVKYCNAQAFILTSHSYFLQPQVETFKKQYSFLYFGLKRVIGKNLDPDLISVKVNFFLETNLQYCKNRTKNFEMKDLNEFKKN